MTTWTEEQIRAYGVRIPGLTALDIYGGVGPTKAYELLAHAHATGEGLPFRVIKIGRRYWVPTHAVLRALGLEP